MIITPIIIMITCVWYSIVMATVSAITMVIMFLVDDEDGGGGVEVGFLVEDEDGGDGGS